MENKKVHIEYLEKNLERFRVLKNHTRKHTVKTQGEIDKVIDFVQLYMDNNPKLYDYIDNNSLDCSRFFWENHFEEELQKLIDNLKSETK